MTTTSIYDAIATSRPAPSPSTRRWSRQRRRERLASMPVELRRRGDAIARLRRRYLSTSAGGEQLRRARDARLKLVDQLESEVQREPGEQRRERERIVRASELLRRCGRLFCRDLSWVEDEDRPLLVEILRLEHRLCYAAAGTTLEDFRAVSGRCGLR